MLSGIDHLVFRVADLAVTERFYNQLLAQAPEHAEGSLLYQTDRTRLFFTIAERGATRHDKENIGFNHLAFRLESLEQLKVILKRLMKAGIKNSGIIIDQYGGNEFIWLDDPDGLRLEFYLRPH